MSKGPLIDLRASGLILAVWGWNYWVELGEARTVVIRHMRTAEKVRITRPTVREAINAAVAFVEQRRVGAAA